MKRCIAVLIVLLSYVSVVVPTISATGKVVPDLELIDELRTENDVAYLTPIDGEYQVVVFWLDETVYITPDMGDAVIVVSKLNDYWKSLDLQGRIQWLNEIALN